jgi:FkbM family methyltransferase
MISIAQLSSIAQRIPFVRRAAQPLIAMKQRIERPGQRRLTTILDRLARMSREDPVLSVEEFYGVFAMDCRSRLFRRVIEQGEYEPILTRLCIEHLDPSRDAIDVGANIGFHTILFAKHLTTGRVLAVEPTRNALRRLKRNICINEVEKRVKVFEGAASASREILSMNVIEGLEEFSSIGAMEHPAVRGLTSTLTTVEARTVDDLVEENGLNPSFIKIDAEGSEHLVLAGCTQTLKQFRPVVVAELSNFLLSKNGSSARDVIEKLISLGYAVSDPLHPFEKPGKRDFGDILCLPT